MKIHSSLPTSDSLIKPISQHSLKQIFLSPEVLIRKYSRADVVSSCPHMRVIIKSRTSSLIFQKSTINCLPSLRFRFFPSNSESKIFECRSIDQSILFNFEIQSDRSWIDSCMLMPEANLIINSRAIFKFICWQKLLYVILEHGQQNTAGLKAIKVCPMNNISNYASYDKNIETMHNNFTPHTHIIIIVVNNHIDGTFPSPCYYIVYRCSFYSFFFININREIMLHCGTLQWNYYY